MEFRLSAEGDRCEFCSITTIMLLTTFHGKVLNLRALVKLAFASNWRYILVPKSVREEPRRCIVESIFFRCQLYRLGIVDSPYLPYPAVAKGAVRTQNAEGKSCSSKSTATF